MPVNDSYRIAVGAVVILTFAPVQLALKLWISPIDDPAAFDMEPPGVIRHVSPELHAAVTSAPAVSVIVPLVISLELLVAAFITSALSAVALVADIARASVANSIAASRERSCMMRLHR
ncbi:MAG TPA: hypothetical protein VE972_06045 [Conexibacter sp.]|nr:hypothetical protein [Conexibacter sp.]